MKSEKLFLVAGYILITLIWGSTWLAIKIGLDSVPPFYGVSLRFSLALAILLIMLLLRGERLPTDKTARIIYVQLGLCSFSLPFALVYWAEQYIPSSLASILFAFYPFVVMILSHFILADERITLFKLIGVLAGFVGLLLIFQFDFSLGSANTRGMIAILVSVLLQGSSLVFAKKYSHHISPVAMNVGGLIVGVPIMYLIAMSTESYSMVHLDVKGILSIVYLGTFGSVVTFGTYYWLLKRMQAVLLSFVSFLTPILAVIFGTIFLSESLSPHIFSGAVLVLGGLVVMNGREVVGIVKGKYEKKSLS